MVKGDAGSVPRSGQGRPKGLWYQEGGKVALLRQELPGLGLGDR